MKVLVPVVGCMLLSMLTTGLVYNFGIISISRTLLEGEVQSDNQKVVASLREKLGFGDTAARMLANDPIMTSALAMDTADSLPVVNSRAVVIRDRFELDLIQIYTANGNPRTNLVQASLYKISSVIGLLPMAGSGIFEVDGRLLYLVREDIQGGGAVVVGIDLASELERIAFTLGLRDTLFLKADSTPDNSSRFSSGEFIFRTPVTIGARTFILQQARQISQFARIANTGRDLILAGTAATAILLSLLLAFVLRSIIRPVRRLAEAARLLAQADFSKAQSGLPLLGEVDHLIPIGVHDEIGQLADAFTHMSAELQGIYGGLVRDLQEANRQLSLVNRDLKESNRCLAVTFEDLQEANRQLNAAYDSALRGWSSALELRDHDTQKHTERVAADVVVLARMMKVPDSDLIEYRRGALLHDVGKMAIPDSILHKPGPLSDDEWKTMRLHPIYAFVMLREIPFLHKALDIPYAHHERWDGSGYPRGLIRTQIPLAARIFGIVDTWDALNSNRSYRAAWPRARALEYIRSQAGRQFDPEIVRLFLQWVETPRTKILERFEAVPA
ncbi:MAG: HD domain-containing protein [Anaerolineales bacterium]|nr:HD domain-containing protein [Anaerolineales bacterium]